MADYEFTTFSLRSSVLSSISTSSAEAAKNSIQLKNHSTQTVTKNDHHAVQSQKTTNATTFLIRKQVNSSVSSRYSGNFTITGLVPCQWQLVNTGEFFFFFSQKSLFCRFFYLKDSSTAVISINFVSLLLNSLAVIVLCQRLAKIFKISNFYKFLKNFCLFLFFHQSSTRNYRRVLLYITFLICLNPIGGPKLELRLMKLY